MVNFFTFLLAIEGIASRIKKSFAFFAAAVARPLLDVVVAACWLLVGMLSFFLLLLGNEKHTHTHTHQ